MCLVNPCGKPNFYFFFLILFFFYSFFLLLLLFSAFWRTTGLWWIPPPTVQETQASQQPRCVHRPRGVFVSWTSVSDGLTDLPTSVFWYLAHRTVTWGKKSCKKKKSERGFMIVLSSLRNGKSGFTWPHIFNSVNEWSKSYWVNLPSWKEYYIRLTLFIVNTCHLDINLRMTPEFHNLRNCKKLSRSSLFGKPNTDMSNTPGYCWKGVTGSSVCGGFQQMVSLFIQTSFPQFFSQMCIWILSNISVNISAYVVFFLFVFFPAASCSFGSRHNTCAVNTHEKPYINIHLIHTLWQLYCAHKIIATAL